MSARAICVPADVAARVQQLLEDLNADGLVALVRSNLMEISRIESARGILEMIAEAVSSSVYDANTAMAYAMSICKPVLAIQGLKGITFAFECCNVERAAGNRCYALGAWEEAQYFLGQAISTPPGATSVMPDVTLMECITKLLTCSRHTKNAEMTNLATLKGLPLYRQLEAEEDTLKGQEAASLAATLSDFQSVFVKSLQARRKYGEASRMLFERYVRVHERADLEMAVLCALLTEAGPMRSTQLSLLQAEPGTGAFGDLHRVLMKAFHRQMFKATDVAVLEAHAGADIPHDAIHDAVVQHNIHAISVVYDSISIAALKRHMSASNEEDVVLIASRMIAERRPSARIDQHLGFIVFRVHESAVALAEWDERIGNVCNRVSYSVNLVLQDHAELSTY